MLYVPEYYWKYEERWLDIKCITFKNLGKFDPKYISISLENKLGYLELQVSSFALQKERNS